LFVVGVVVAVAVVAGVVAENCHLKIKYNIKYL
jgi:hypothetical protein